MTLRARKALASLTKRHKKYGHGMPFTDIQFYQKISDSIRDGGCAYCFGPLTWDNFSPDHVIPLQKEGSPELSNIEIVCVQCNWEKAANLDRPQAFRIQAKGYRIGDNK